MQNKTYEHEYKPYGELEYCCKCMGLEGDLPTDCPEETLTKEQSADIYAGHLDFCKETGWTKALSPMGRHRVQSFFFKVHLRLAGHDGLVMEDIYKQFPVELHEQITKLIEDLTASEKARNR